MNHSLTSVLLSCWTLVAPVSPSINDSPPSGRLVFEDAFERDESQEIKDEVGNGWTTNGDKPWSKGQKQTDLRDGHLVVTPANGERSDVLVIRPCDFRSGTVQFRFLLPHDDDQIGLVIADSHLKDVHAGHVMNVLMKRGSVKVSDMLHGSFDPEIYGRRKNGTLTKADRQRIADASKTFEAPIEIAQWHMVTITTHKDELTVSIDGRRVGKFAASGFAHRKTILRVSFRRSGMLDDFQLYVNDSKRPTQ